MFEKSTFLSAMFVLFRSTSDCWIYWRFSKSKVQWEPLFTSSQEKNCHSPHHSSTVQRKLRLDSVQDFLIKLGIKPRLYILKISIFSLNHVIVRSTNIMDNFLKLCKICTFKVVFRHQKSTLSF